MSKFRTDLRNAFFRTTPAFSNAGRGRPELRLARLARRKPARSRDSADPDPVWRPDFRRTQRSFVFAGAMGLLVVATAAVLLPNLLAAKTTTPAANVEPRPTGSARATAVVPLDANPGSGPQAPATVSRSPATIVKGPFGLRVDLPPGWIAGRRFETYVDIRRTGAASLIVRVGGFPATQADVLAVCLALEADQPAGYRRLRLEPSTHAGAPAVLWEYELAGVRTREVRWRTGKNDYSVRLSVPSPAWNQSAENAFDEILRRTSVR